MFDSDQSGPRASSIQLIDKQLRLTGKWLITSAKSLHHDIMELDGVAIGDAAIETIDCTSVRSIDLAGIQLLISLRKSQTHGETVSIQFDEHTEPWLALCNIDRPSTLLAAR